MNLAPLRLLPSYREKIWGATDLEPWFRATQTKIGEVWFTFDENRTECGRRLSDLIREFGPAFLGSAAAPGGFPILVKFLFTSDRLSIQVHPDDEHARMWDNSPGKTEMWYVLRAEAGASIALGFHAPMTRERLRDSAVSGEIEKLVRWVPVRAGDALFAPPGTVHAIGPGLALCEIQQNSDITYRLYDYGRPRPLHVDKAVAVANLEAHPGPLEPVEVESGRRLLARCRYFATELLEFEGRVEYRPDPERVHTLVMLEGSGVLGGRCFGPGECWLVPACADGFAIEAESPVRLLRTYVPGER